MWLIEKNTFEAMNLARKGSISAEQQAEFKARDHSLDVEAASKGKEEAVINITGVLTQTPDIFAAFFGGGNTTYPSIIKAIERAEQGSYKSIIYNIDSPGGSIDGLFETVAAMRSSIKPSKAVAKSQCASAAYALATQADSVEASSVASMVGSVGTVISQHNSDSEITLTNTKSPKKHPDARTEEGKEVIIETLDAAYDLFADAIATGRGTTVQKINANFGQGAMLFANEALKRGMIDAINKPALRAVTTKAALGGQQAETIMDLSTFKAQHPDLYASVLAEGELHGKNKERDRVTAHLVSGEMSGQVSTAIKAVKDGTEMTETLRSTYLMAAANRSDIQARDADDSDAGNPVDTPIKDDAAQANSIFAVAGQMCGVEVKV